MAGLDSSDTTTCLEVIGYIHPSVVGVRFRPAEISTIFGITTMRRVDLDKTATPHKPGIGQEKSLSSEKMGESYGTVPRVLSVRSKCVWCTDLRHRAKSHKACSVA